MLLLAFFNSPSVFSVLATIGIVDCTFRPPLRSIPFPFFVHGMAVLLLLDGMEWNKNVTVFLAATVPMIGGPLYAFQLSLLGVLHRLHIGLTSVV